MGFRPGIFRFEKLSVASVGDDPAIIVGVSGELRWTASVGPTMPPAPIIRLTQPRRSLEPGLESSISSIALKCERLGTSRPTACTAAIFRAFQSGRSGAILGCSPNIASPASTEVFETANEGRAR